MRSRSTRPPTWARRAWTAGTLAKSAVRMSGWGGADSAGPRVLVVDDCETGAAAGASAAGCWATGAGATDWTAGAGWSTVDGLATGPTIANAVAEGSIAVRVGPSCLRSGEETMA